MTQNPDRFAYLGLFSAAMTLPSGFSAADAKELNQHLTLIWVCTGRTDEYLPSWIGPGRDALIARGVTHQYVEIDGVHEWQVWRKCLWQFAPKLFKSKASLAQFGLRFSEYPDVSGRAVIEARSLLGSAFRLERSTDLSIWEIVGDRFDIGMGSESIEVDLASVKSAYFRLAEQVFN